jgi:AcrR family transcriptional regulator
MRRVQVTSARSGRAAPLPPDERRIAILKAVLPVVRARGTDVTTRELAEAAEVAEGTLFRVFDDKESLVREAIASALDPGEFLAELRIIDLGLPVEERLAAVIRTGVSRMADLALWMSMFHRKDRGSAPEGPGGRGAHAGPRQGWAERQEATQVLVRAELRRILEPDADRFRVPVDVGVLMLEAMLTGTIMQSANRLRQGHGALDTDAGVVVDFFLHGALRPEATP